MYDAKEKAYSIMFEQMRILTEKHFACKGKSKTLSIEDSIYPTLEA